MSGDRRNTVVRWLKFNAVGVVGILVQLAVLAVLKGGMRVDYLVATGLAVEAAVVHNFLWHERFTWKDRPGKDRLWRLIKFNLSSGMISIVGNLVVMKLLVGVGHINYLMANAVAIAVCSIVNFLMSDRFVFEEAG
ncbi:MAG: GtrA family protein [Acidobacteriia bacterium]|nr:GtrA family protein [Terriglobia bacterium]